MSGLSTLFVQGSNGAINGFMPFEIVSCNCILLCAIINILCANPTHCMQLQYLVVFLFCDGV